jgi:hypothetical protein
MPVSMTGKVCRFVSQMRSRVAGMSVVAGMLLIAVAAGPQEPDASDGSKFAVAQTANRIVVAKDGDKKVKPALDVTASFKKQMLPLLSKYCFECHGKDDPDGGLNLQLFTDETSIRAAQRKWEVILQKVDSGSMPPADHEPLPSKEERKRFVKWIDETLFYVNCDLPPDPGRVTIRRLNRAEYDNTIRDLVGVDFAPAEDFPSDDVGYGFDNIGDVLSVQTLLMEKYLDAAEKIAASAIVIVNPKEVRRREAEKLKKPAGVGGSRFGFVRLSTNGEVFDQFNFPISGEYVLRAEAAAEQAGDEPAKMEFRIDGKTIKVFEVRGYRKRTVFETVVKVEQGKRKFAAAFINDYYNPDAEDPKQRDRNLAIRFLEVQGPIKHEYNDLPETHRRIIFVQPDDKKTALQRAGEILQRLATRAFRCPVKDEELEKFVKLVELTMNRKESFEHGIQVAMQAILVSPHFLFRVELNSESGKSNGSHRITDYQLASRLSYFLWSSMPDDALFSLAEIGTLHRPDVLEQQVNRMLKDPKSRALVENFALQWLNLRILDDVSPDPKKYPQFSDTLRADMRRETEHLFEAVMREDRNILDFLDADFTFLNERLAKHYGISGIQGEQFRKVALTDGRRAGVLTHASILTLTSETMRTSPVKRGKWILENILGTPPPPPPPNVPLLEETIKSAKGASLRKQLEIHRANPVCASCHVLMDGLGFGFENFDAVGRWRDMDGNEPVDASGKLPTGETFSGPVELVKILKTREREFGHCLTEKMLTYALGRGLEYYDECTVDQITTALSKDGYRFSTLVREIVTSDPFLLQRNEEGNSDK